MNLPLSRGQLSPFVITLGGKVGGFCRRLVQLRALQCHSVPLQSGSRVEPLTMEADDEAFQRPCMVLAFLEVFCSALWSSEDSFMSPHSLTYDTLHFTKSPTVV